MVLVVGGSVVVVVVDVVVVVVDVVVVVVDVVVVVVVEVVVVGDTVVAVDVVVVEVVVVGDTVVAVVDEEPVAAARVVVEPVTVAPIGSLTTVQLMGMFCARHLPVRGLFNARVTASMHALARPPGYKREIFRDPLLHRWSSARDIIRVCMFTHSEGARSNLNQESRNSPRESQRSVGDHRRSSERESTHTATRRS